MSIPKLDLDLNFRPQSYFLPLNERSHVVAAIKGAERRAYVERMARTACNCNQPRILLASLCRFALRSSDEVRLIRFLRVFRFAERWGMLGV